MVDIDCWPVICRRWSMWNLCNCDCIGHSRHLATAGARNLRGTFFVAATVRHGCRFSSECKSLSMEIDRRAILNGRLENGLLRRCPIVRSQLMPLSCGHANGWQTRDPVNTVTHRWRCADCTSMLSISQLSTRWLTGLAAVDRTFIYRIRLKLLIQLDNYV